MRASSASSDILDVTAATFQRDVLDESHRRPVVVDFWAEWCGPCRALGPVLERLAREAGGDWRLVKIDTEQEPRLAEMFRIRSIPAVKAFKDGQQVSELVGALPEGQIRGWLRGFVPNAADKAVSRGLDLLAAGDLDAAHASFTEALSMQADHLGARMGLCRVALAAGSLDEARAQLDAIPAALRDAGGPELARLDLEVRGATAGDAAELQARLAADPDDHEARIALGHAAAAAGRWDEAFETWLLVVRKGPAPQKEAARKALLEGFAAAGHPELVASWRKQLAAALYT